MTATTTDLWQAVCHFGDLLPERGVCALVDGVAVAIYRTFDDQLFALENMDPKSHASVMSRGIVGTRGSVPIVVSPIYKQAFDLATGMCLDDPNVAVQAYAVRLTTEQLVEVNVRCPN